MTLRFDLVDRYVTVDGRKLRYLEAGQGRPLLLVHALSVQNSADQWLTSFDELSKVTHVYAIDLPGWGLSDPLPEPSFPLWVEALKGFVDALDLGVIDVMGQSLGGWISGLFVHKYPQRVRRYVWLAQAGMNPDAPQSSASFRLPTREALERLYATPAMGNAIYDQMTSRPDREALFKRTLDYINDDKVRSEFSMRSRLPEMKMPILIGQGDANRAIPVEYALEAFRLAPLGRLTVAMGGSAPGGYNSPELVAVAIKFLTMEEITPA